MNIIESMSFFELLSILILSLVPTIVLASIVLISDQKSREPLRLMLVCIFSGFFTISLSLLLGRIVLPQLNVFRDSLFNIETFSVIRIVILALIEEYSKFIVLYIFMSHNKKFDDLYDGFVYAALISLSFAGMETLLYVFNESTYQDMASLAVLRNVSTIPLHLVCGIAMGYFIAVERFSKKKQIKLKYLILSLFIPTFIHTFYNIFFSLTMINLRTKSFALIVIILFLTSIYGLGYLFYKKIKEVNIYFDENIEYPKQYKFLMTKEEFIKNRILKDSKEATLEEIIYNEEDFSPFNN